VLHIRYRTARRRTGLWIAAALTIICMVALVSVAVVRGYAVSGRQTVTVMTRNIYLGGDINRPIRAAYHRAGREGLLALGHANHELREIVDRTDFRSRSKLLANEIAAARPDLVGLQEVALWRHGPMQLDQIGRLNATQVDYDFLDTLLADLADRGVRYQVVHIQQESDVEAPAFTGDPFTGTASSAEDVRLTDRDVIMVRSGAEIRIEGSGGSNYSQQLDVNLADTAFRFVRGYAWADVAVGSAHIRFITTHLESQSPKLASAQAGELLGGLANLSQSIVITCDCNSNQSALRPIPAFRLARAPRTG